MLERFADWLDDGGLAATAHSAGRWLVCLASAGAIVVFAQFCSGCQPDAREVTQHVLSAQAQVVMETQAERHDLYGDAHGRCLEVGQSVRGEPQERYDAYRDCMQPYRIAARAVDAYVGALHSAQAALLASDDASFGEMLPCLVEAATEAAQALRTAGLPVPSAVGDVMGLASSAMGACGND